MVDTRAALETRRKPVDFGQQDLEKRDCNAQVKVDVPRKYMAVGTDQVQMKGEGFGQQDSVEAESAGMERAAVVQVDHDFYPKEKC